MIFFGLDEVSYLRAELVRIDGSDLIDAQVATLILLPKNGNGLTGNWSQLFEILQQVSKLICKF